MQGLRKPQYTTGRWKRNLTVRYDWLFYSKIITSNKFKMATEESSEEYCVPLLKLDPRDKIEWIDDKLESSNYNSKMLCI